MSRRDADVIVVGGGPAGSTTATLLAQTGIDVLLLDRAAFPREKACAEYLSPGTVAILRRLGLLEAVLASCPAVLHGIQVGTISTHFLLDYRGSSVGSGLGIARSALDAILLDHARGAGVRVEERIRVRRVVRDHNRVVGVEAATPEGTVGRGARFVVGADGIHSAVARSLGLDLPIHWPWPRRLGLVARYRDAQGIGGVGQIHVGRDAYCGLAPVDSDTVNVGLVTELGSKPQGEPTSDYFERKLSEIPGTEVALAGGRRVTPIRGVGPLAKRVRQTAGPGFVLVGDAAGFFDPFTGEGIHRALRGAELASAAIAQALARGLTEPAGYTEARREAFRDKERVCLLIQGFLASPRLFEYATRHISERPPVAKLLTGVLGDYAPARPALHPAFLWSLLRP